MSEQMSLWKKELSSNWNPRFECYAAAHGNAPEMQLEIDELDYPGGCMYGFISWSNARMKEWSKICGVQRDEPGFLRSENAAAYDVWLSERYLLGKFGEETLHG